MKGFKKDGNFIPTGNKTKSNLKKSDVRKKVSTSSGDEHEIREKKTINKFTEVRKLETNVKLEIVRANLVINNLEHMIAMDESDELYYEKLDLERMYDVLEKLEEIDKLIQPVLDNEDY